MSSWSRWDSRASMVGRGAGAGAGGSVWLVGVNGSMKWSVAAVSSTSVWCPGGQRVRRKDQ